MLSLQNDNTGFKKPFQRLVVGSSLLVFLFCSSMFTVQADEKVLTFNQAVSRYGGEGTRMWGLLLKENFQVPAPSALYKIKETTNKTEVTLCNGLDDVACLGADLYQILRLDPCTENSQLSCQGVFWGVDPTGKKIEGKLVRTITFDSRQAVKENLDLNLPANNSIGSIWQLPGVINSSGGDKYLVFSNLTMFKRANENKFSYGEINNSIVAIEELRGNYGVPQILFSGGSAGSGPQETPDGRECLALEQGVCQAPVEFPVGYRFGMTLKIGESLNGWFHGRMSLPQIAIQNWKSGQEISIEGEPVRVSSLDFVVPVDQLSEEQVALYNQCVKGNCGGRGKLTGVAQTGGNLSHPDSMNLVSKFTSAYRDRATSTASTWAFRNMFNHAGSIDSGKINSCSRGINSLNGIVLTNALAYSSGPPTFDEKSGSLVYQVASPHFEENGSLASGTYDLTMRSEVARCLYDFSSAPIKAEVSITGSDGENRVATTVVSEKDGWLYLSARGFTYSSPTIRVKLTQEKASPTQEKQVVVEAQTNQQKATPVLVPKLQKTIMCAKGKLTKKVVGLSPKCPAGYKKK